MFSLQEGDADTLDRTAGAIRGRSARVCNVVSAEMDNYEPGPYTDRVMEAVVLLRDQGNFLFINYHMGLVARKPVFRVSDKASFEPVSSATETRQKVEISPAAKLHMILSKNE